jgi:hypothetical protein
MTDGAESTPEITAAAPTVAAAPRPAGFQPGNAGRPPGTPNKATTAAREAIAKFVDGNAPRLQQWLDQVAHGVMDPDPTAPPGRFLIKPNPERAFEMAMSVVEYHVPKLARTELTGEGGGPVIVQSTPMDEGL